MVRQSICPVSFSWGNNSKLTVIIVSISNARGQRISKVINRQAGIRFFIVTKVLGGCNLIRN